MKMTGIPLSCVVGFEVFAHLVAVHLRHIDVQQDQVRGIASAPPAAPACRWERGGLYTRGP